ncbi:glycosyltransferase [Candidatus Pseudothioglobus singularis]|nr:glycosyltransferase [Candidatus Pseudothioglobus singularis]
MNILFIGSSSDWHVDLWVKYFSKNHKVYLFSDKEDYLKNQPFNNVKIIESEGYLGKILNFFNIKSHLLFQFNKLISVKHFAMRVDYIIKEFDIDVVHAHSLYYGYLLSFINLDLPKVFTPMGSDIIIYSQKSRIHKFMAKRVFSKISIITSDSFLLQKSGYKFGAKKERNYIIQNGVDSSIFFPKDNNLRKAYNINNDEILFFSPRAITPLYNIDIIIDAIGNLKQSGYKVKCMFSFAFGSKYSSKLKEQIRQLGLENNIIWLGFLDYKQMAEHYNAADIIISVPSSDSSPKSVYEAMFCKKPVVVSNLDWSYELLSECECLVRVNVRDILQLSEALSNLIDNTELRMQISINAFKFAHKYFDYENNMKKMEKIMFQSLSSNDQFK